MDRPAAWKAALSVAAGLVALLASAGAATVATPAPGRADDAPAPAAEARRMAVTFDDLPVGGVLRPDTASQRRITAALLAAVTAHRVPAIGFVNESKLEVDGRPDPARVELLQMWLDAGLELGNHSFSHPDLHRVEVGAYLADVARGEEVTRRLLAAAGRELRFFRHPFLHTGRGLEAKRRVEAFLADRGVRVAPVTIDSSEWIFAAAWDRAGERGDEAARRRLLPAYLDYMERKTAYYEAQSRDLLGREIPQVLLLHANPLNAHAFDRLAAVLAARGYRFVPLEEALADPAYGSPDTYTGPAGISWLHRWALSRGVAPGFFAGEPQAPAWVLAEAGMASE